MNSIQQLLGVLWRESASCVTCPDGKHYNITFSRPHDFFDVMMHEDCEPMGFITLKQEGGGVYSIVNETKTNPHPGFTNTPGHGIEVKERYRKRGIGKALLSIGIGLVQQDWREKGKPGEFTVVASDVTASGLGCYQNFGFIVKEGMAVTQCSYRETDYVPDFLILPKKASLLKRFKKRLRLGR